VAHSSAVGELCTLPLIPSHKGRENRIPSPLMGEGQRVRVSKQFYVLLGLARLGGCDLTKQQLTAVRFSGPKAEGEFA
jgi:hypothetical protein